MKFQKLTAGLLALSMLCAPSAEAVQMLTAAAEETAPTSGTCGENVTWTYDESTKTLTISGTGDMVDYGLNVTYPWNDIKLEARSVIIEDGVTSIGEKAFMWFIELTSVTIPDSVTSIGEWAFHRCDSLTGITIPEGMTSIGEDAFNECTSLTDITIPASVASIGDGAFDACTSLTDITILNPDCEIDDSITVCNEYVDGRFVFYGTIHGYTNSTAQAYAEKYDRKFESLGDAPGSSDEVISGTCGENVTWTFDKSTGTLTISGTGEMNYPSISPWTDFRHDILTVIIEDGVTCIGENAFQDCTSLTDVTIPDSVTYIRAYAFFHCTSLTEITIPDSVRSIIGCTFYECTSLTEITIPDSVKRIGSNVFHGCKSLTEITIPDSVTIIGDEAFRACTSLTDITILNPDCEMYDSPATICNGHNDDSTAFFTGTIHGYANSTAQAYAEKYGYTFKSLDDAPDTPDEPTSGTCGENLTWTFDESTGVLTISGTGEMEDCEPSPWVDFTSDIQTVVIEDGVTSIGNWAFDLCYNLTEITIPDSVTSIGKLAFSSTPWLTAMKKENPLVVVNHILIDGLTCSGDVTIPDSVTSIGELAFYGCKDLTSVTIPDSVTSIGYQAFDGCSGLTSLTIPDSVTTIADEAFTCSGLTSVTIPGSVTSIGDKTFEGCTELTSVTIPDSVTSICDYAFFGCGKLTSITIPDSVTSIGDGAFYGCTSLTSVTIPDSVTSIGNYAFVGCKNLTEITIQNPDCVIYDGAGTIANDYDGQDNYVYTGTICGYDNSTAQAYAGKYGYIFESLGEAPDAPTLAVGNVNGDAEIDASDAADLLIALANIGAGEDSGLTAAQIAAADADGNGELDAGDAAIILQYAAYLGSGGTGTLADFLNN